MNRFACHILCLILIGIFAPCAEASPVMALYEENGRIMARIPSSTMGRRVLMASVIEQTSDSGEGLAGQMSDNCISLVFTVSGSSLVVSIPPDMPVRNLTADRTIDEAVSAVSVAGEWKRYDIRSFNAAGEAVVDLTDLFQTQYAGLYTFPAGAYNSMGGQVRREHKLIKEMSRFAGIEEADGMVSVLCDFRYKMDGYVMGVMKIAGDYSLRALVRKILFFPRDEDSAPVGIRRTSLMHTAFVEQRMLESEMQPIRGVDVVRRWRVQPSDSLAWEAGEIVRPKDKIVFHVDSSMPEAWKPYVREGVLAWNEAFKGAGFDEVVGVSDFAHDSLSVRWSPYVSRIIFAPSGMQEVEVTSLYDNDDAEIFSSTICFHSSVLQKYKDELVRTASASCPALRQGNLPDSLYGGIIRLLTMRAVGKALGLKEGVVTTVAYPTDSLSSGGFTRKYGLTPSVMEPVVFNYIAQEDDVDSGAALMSCGVGSRDRDAIVWLYGPESVRSEYHSEILPDKPVLRGELGDDPFKALEAWTRSHKKLLENLHGWFGDCGEDYMSSVVTATADQYARRIVQIVRYVGKDSMTPDMQSRAVHEVISHLRDMDWLRNVPSVELPYGTNEYIGDVYRTNIFETLLNRADRLGTEYSESDFLGEIVKELFSSASLRRNGTQTDMMWREKFIAFLSGRTDSSAAYATMAQVDEALRKALSSAPQEHLEHYRYLLFLTDRWLNCE